MKNKSLFLILLVILAILTVSVSSSFAQDVDISNMDNAQLMALLQAIMEKLADSGNGQQDAGEIGNQESDQLKVENGELKIVEAG